jgi:dTMP kinase
MSTTARCQNTSVAAAKFITLEGVDGAGKSSHLAFIQDFLASRAEHVIVTREPGGTGFAERLRETVLSEAMDPVAETLVMFAARADHVTRVIRPALAAGTWVICDRFTDATYVYQGAGKGVPEELILNLEKAVHPGLQPDRTLVFDCTYEIAKQRLAGKLLDRFEREDRAFFERVRSAYLSRARAEPDRVRVIDAGGSMAEVRKSLEKHLAFS